jgi:hypothetical protein
MAAKAHLPRTAKDIFHLSPIDWLIYNAVIWLARLTRCWRYPIPASGDLETMTRKDKIYWLYKAQFPVVRAARKSGLESYFAEHQRACWTLPKGFAPAAELELSAVGDLMDHPYLLNSADVLYEAVGSLLFDADVSMANLECVVYEEQAEDFVISPSRGPSLYYKPGHFAVLKGCSGRSYTFMATACNHSLDCGEAGARSTVRTLRQSGIAFNGLNESSADARTASIIRKKGVNVGLISHTFGVNARKPPVAKPWIADASQRTSVGHRLQPVLAPDSILP